MTHSTIPPIQNSIIATLAASFRLAPTPAYDLICTSLHFPDEARTALPLFDAFETESFRQNAFYARPDFLKLSELYGMNPVRAERCLRQFPEAEDRVVDLVGRSFLSEAACEDFLVRFRDRQRTLRHLH